MLPLGISAGLLDVAVTSRTAAAVSTSPTVNGIAAVEVSSLMNWLATSETDGRSFTELTVMSNVSVAMPPLASATGS